jgi:hypothetical protein
MTDKTPPPEKDPAALEPRQIDIPVPTKDPTFWLKIVRQAYNETFTFGGLSILLMLVGIGVDVGGINLSHQGWSAEVLGIKLQNAGPGDLLIVAALFIFWTSRFHVKTRRIFSARAQLITHRPMTAAEQKEVDTNGPPDDTELWNTIVDMQATISRVFGWVALGMLAAGVVLVFFGFDLSNVNWSAEGFGLKLVNTGPGVTLVIAAALIRYGSQFSVGVEGIGETRSLIKRARWDDHTKQDDKIDPKKDSK